MLQAGTFIRGQFETSRMLSTDFCILHLEPRFGGYAVCLSVHAIRTVPPSFGDPDDPQSAGVSEAGSLF